MKKKIYIIVFCFLYFPVAFSQKQESISLKILTYSSEDQKVLSKYTYKKNFSSEIEAFAEVKTVIYDLFSRGFLTARLDSIKNDTNRTSAYLFIGEKYELASLCRGNVDSRILNDIGCKYKNYKGNAINFSDISNSIEKILKYCENNGYPFAEVFLDSLELSGNKLSGALNLKKNTKILIDSIIVKGNGKISRKYLQSYLSIKPNELYNEAEIKAISTKIKEIPFISEIKPPEVIFIKDKAKINIYLNKKKASQFNGIIGVMPNDKTTGKLLINGELKLKLLSAFGRGELIDFFWRSIEKSTQELNVNFAFPYLFSTPFGIDYKFNLFKKDTSYLTLNHNIGIQYLFSTISYIKAFAEIQSSSIIKASGLENATVLPDYADISSTLYGIELVHEKLDYRLNPRKGFFLKISGAAGLKNIKVNDKVNPVLYDSLQLRSNQYKFAADAGVFFPFLRRHTFYFNSKDGYIVNNNLFDNELFKIGGLKTLKGFDEESIHASLFTILTFEYRFLFERNSYFCLFANAAYYEKRLHNSFMCDSPYGFGAGINFETKIGIFSFYYALGSEFGNPIEFKQSKIHFGITSYF